MMAESLPFPVGNPVPTWDLESWYEDLQEVLSLDVSSRTDPPVGGQEWEEFSLDDTPLLWDLEALGTLEPSGSPAAGACELSPHLSTELLGLLGEEPVGAPESDSSRSSPPQTGTDEEEVSTSRKRKRSRQPQGGKRQRGREQEQQNEHRVAELMAQNERLREEIERLSAEVEATRAALIQRMVSLKS
ncbi:DNA damage-inducible transcript 3 protein [Anolis carolinensis]|uniref:DNA damage-inducible transcript 3 protein n=1 Tax=Anolis carolinensis TaxID=28377 RepID=UPI0002039FCA|nr:PREDICTED: DNA damage-inducible transcript 3 protein [Anolis carolinensis]XP_016850716.1 PREDICTED: DNA damage-inducible transcript 3 protein [Anolis carolinensis]|eukprot:XP_003223673.1 PREDICTED: DNA damage-inducible transcript 3 protein [Anolis carolinensis]